MKIAQFFSGCLVAVALIMGATVAHAGGAPGVTGPDDFEPNEGPLKARFLAFEDEGNSSREVYNRNFDRPNDVDWFYFRADSFDLFAFVRTRNLFSRADTFISVYRLVNSDGTGDNDEVNCDDGHRLRLNADRDLLSVACNDDIAPGDLSSEVTFDIETPGVYFIRVINKFVANNDKAEGEGEPYNAFETTYGLEATYFGIVPGGIVASVYNEATEDPITNAIVRVTTQGFNVTVNTNGVYSLGALATETYELKTEAPGFVTQTKSVSVDGGGEFQNVLFPMVSTAPKHSLDYALPPNDLSLAELLRAIQFYNIGAFGCDPNTEDNYSPGVGAQNCAPHSADYISQDWRIDLSELLRLIQLYNAANGFIPCEGGEDGFCPQF